MFDGTACRAYMHKVRDGLYKAMLENRALDLWSYGRLIEGS